MQLKRIALVLAISLVALGTLAACSDDDDTGAPAATTPAADGGDATPAGPALLEQPEPPQDLASEVTDPAEGIIEMTAAETIFVNNNLAMPLGEPVTIRVLNNDLVTHNLRIAGLDGEFQTEDDAVTAPAMIIGGETGELQFAPPVAGQYTFRCDFHQTMMGGQITVE